MEHIGIDLGACHSHIAVLNAVGEKIATTKIPTSSLPAWLAGRETSCIVMEACTQSPAVARAGLLAGHKVTVVPGQLVRAIGIGRRGIKTDDRDALVLAEASYRIANLPSVHLRSLRSADIRSLLNTRHILVDARKGIATNCKSFVRGRLQSIKGRASSKNFSKVLRETALAHQDGLPSGIDKLLTTFDHLSDQIDELDAELATLIEDDPVCKNLMTMPGVGPQIALSFMTQIDDPLRFPSADHVGSYLALTPGEATTGGKVVRTGTLRAGPLRLKALFVQGAWSLWRCRPNDPLVLWARALADKRGKKIAIVAMARKMAVILWSMWKNNLPYDAARASSVRLNTEQTKDQSVAA